MVHHATKTHIWVACTFTAVLEVLQEFLLPSSSSAQLIMSSRGPPGPDISCLEPSFLSLPSFETPPMHPFRIRFLLSVLDTNVSGWVAHVSILLKLGGKVVSVELVAWLILMWCLFRRPRTRNLICFDHGGFIHIGMVNVGLGCVCTSICCLGLGGFGLPVQWHMSVIMKVRV